MKRYVFILLLSFPEIVFAQKQLNEILKSEINYIENFSIEDLRKCQYFLPSRFASDSLLTDSAFEKLKSLMITRVELVYTTFREAPTFNQYDLNYRRLQSLQKILPGVFGNDLIAWSQLAITGVHSSEDGKNTFHGFIFTYRLPSSKESSKKEVEYLKNLISDSAAVMPVNLSARNYKKMPVYKEMTYDEMRWPQFKGGDEALSLYLKKNLKYPKDEIDQHRQGTINVQFEVDRYGKPGNVKVVTGIDKRLNELAIKFIEQMPLWTPGLRNGKPATVTMVLPIKFNCESKSVDTDSIPVDKWRDYRPHGRFREVKVDSVDATESYAKQMEEQDSLVFKAISRNNWTNMLMICDVTGSMTPYTGQLLLWLKLNIDKGKISHFVFFNDGDNLLTGSSGGGMTGGIYPVTSNHFDDVTAVMFTCMQNGDGGDTPENNIETAITAIKLFPECDTIVMIADNFATPHDLEMLSKVHKPMKIILCGTYAGINVKYMNMIRKNHGSLHTIEQDIFNLSQMREGESIEINGIDYILEEGGFKKIRKL